MHDSARFPTPTRRPAPAGFTLIELLIVVAIIAILAAIAVPNYLEAQTRAKVARARADLRSTALALESYRLDLNAYPTMREPGFAGGVAPLKGADLKWWYLPNALSTPVGYLGNADLRCPFGGDLPRRGDFPDEIWRRYSYENIRELEAATAAGYSVLAGKYGRACRAYELIGGWRILCNGPDNSWNPMFQYDPSNGTVSAGNIMRTQNDPQGIGSEQR
jgi:prepilin-type N-terminal cleavage/methylation domain-containing protein